MEYIGIAVNVGYKISAWQAAEVSELRYGSYVTHGKWRGR